MSVNIGADILKVNNEYKLDKLSNDFRLAGNEKFQNKEWFNALVNYNKSISFAKSKSVAALTYGNRSAVYLEVKLYEHCLQNIQWARENGYPANKMSKLIEREVKCKELMAKQKNKEPEDFWDFFKLSYPANEKIPWLVDCVEMKWTEKDGRGIYAKQDLKAGDIICVEEPVFNYTKAGFGYYQCYNCFHSNKMNLIPCDFTASIMFCSTACKEKICSKAVNMNEIVCPDVKLLSEIAAHFGGVKAFDNHMKRTDLKTLNKSIFDHDLSDKDDPKYDDNRINCLLSLCTNRLQVEILSNIRKYVSKKTAHHLVSLFDLNNKEACLFDGKGKKITIGYFISLFASLINHACIGNVNCFLVDGKAITIIEKPVKAGEQIVESYTGAEVLSNDSLRKNLEEQHMFKCDCNGCSQNLILNLDELERGIFEIFRFPPRMYQHNYEYVKQCLEDARNDINENPEDHRVLSSSLITAIMLMEAVGFHCAYPF